MMDLRHLQTMYQQWADGQGDAITNRWLDFVEMVSRNHSVPADEIIRQLQKTYWFQWPKQ